jgi:hypothetical protein
MQESFGSVCSLDFDVSQKLLIAGYERGDLILWDVVSGSQMK